MKEKQAEIEAANVQMRKMRQALQELSHEEMRSLSVTVKKIPKRTVASLRGKIHRFDEEGRLWVELGEICNYTKIREAHTESNQYSHAITHHIEFEEDLLTREKKYSDTNQLTKEKNDSDTNQLAKDKEYSDMNQLAKEKKYSDANPLSKEKKNSDTKPLANGQTYSVREIDVEVQRIIEKLPDEKVQMKAQEVCKLQCSTDRELSFIQIPECEAATLVFQGRYDQIGEMNAYMAKWVKLNGYRIIGKSFVTYYLSPGNESNPDRFVTEVCFPVTQNK